MNMIVVRSERTRWHPSSVDSENIWIPGKKSLTGFFCLKTLFPRRHVSCQTVLASFTRHPPESRQKGGDEIFNVYFVEIFFEKF